MRSLWLVGNIDATSMLPRLRTYYREVRRQIRASSDAVWITEEVLSCAFHRFCFISKTFKCHGSSVPGPMESRRRLGKRRLANVSDAVHTHFQDFGSWWGLSGYPEQSQWHWEAPTKHPFSILKKDMPTLPAWLTEYEPAPPGGLHVTVEAENPKYLHQSISSRNIKGNLHQFRETLKTASADEIQQLCSRFTQTFKQNLTLALVPEEVLIASLQYFTNDIWEITVDKKLAVSRCMSFYWATWEGIKSSRVLRPTELGASVLNKILALLSQLESSESVQTLAVDIIYALTTDQLQEMEAGLLSLVEAWVPSWMGSSDSVLGKSARQEESLAGSWNKKDCPKMVLKESIMRLASSLGRLPPELASKIVYKTTDHVICSIFSKFVGQIKTQRILRYSWVSMVANMPCIDEDLLLRICCMSFIPTVTQHYAPRSSRMTLREISNILLDYWISHDQIKAPERIRATFRAATQIADGTNDARQLLHAVDRHRELCWSKAKLLFRFLRNLEKPQAIYTILLSLRGTDIKFPVSLLASEVQEMSRIDARCALNIYKLYPTLCYKKKALHLDGCPGLVMAMINDPTFKTCDIWRALGIPPYNPRKLTTSTKSLCQVRVNLVYRMALEFAQAQCRTPRDALRNVMRCVMYLRKHNVALSPALTRAISYAGITRDLLREHWVGTEKALWILDLVKRVEGEEVAKSMDMIVYCWRIGIERQASSNGVVAIPEDVTPEN